MIRNENKIKREHWSAFIWIRGIAVSLSELMKTNMSFRFGSQFSCDGAEAVFFSTVLLLKANVLCAAIL